MSEMEFSGPGMCIGINGEARANFSRTESTLSIAAAVFECLELLRDQLWLAYGPEIQRAWRDQLAPQQLTLPIDPSDPF